MPAAYTDVLIMSLWGRCGWMDLILTAKDITLFWAKVTKDGPNGCWIWTGTRSLSGGYGIFDRRREGVRIARRAHRLAYELLRGPIPDELLLRHKCDNSPCVNPDHLEPGTEKDNSQDMIRRGRHWTQVRPEAIPRGENHWTALKGSAALPRGELHPNARLTLEQVQEIRRCYAAGGVSQRQLARDFGVCQGTIYQVIHGNYWKEVS
jgi:hypothetical protein